MDKKEKFIEKARKKHGNKYDYSKVEYIDSITKVCIICPIHGEFWQTPQGHLRGNSCPKCANKKRGDTFRSNGDTFIERANIVHNGKYIYDKDRYVNAETKIPILCLEHGTFWMTPMNHLLGQGCPKCSGRGLNTDEIIQLFKDKHGDEYDYSKVVFNKMHEKVCIICKEHGEFWQTPSKHLLGQGCPKCGINKRAEEKNIGQDEFIRRCKAIYGDDYIYNETEYDKMENKVKIICPKHGEFWQKPYDHLHGHGCPKCGLIESRGETELYEYICSLIGKENVEHSNREILNGYEIDIYIPRLKIGIEYNGLKWHSDKFRDRNYHLMKTNLANEKDVKLIQLFEDEYIQHKDIVLSKIRRLLHIDKDTPSIMARKCNIKIIEKNNAKNFLDKNHIQGYKGCSVAIGCFYNEALIGVMTFEQYSDEWILNRFATDNNFICQGVGGKLFSFFVKNYNPTVVKSFADLRWTINKDNNLYTKLGFEVDEILKPDYKYVNSSHPTERIHKFNFRKKIISKHYDLDYNETESKLTEKLGYYKIWDCGLIRYKWIKN
jgi:hypothetical protein